MKLIKDFPRDSCKSFSSEEISEVLGDSAASRAEKSTPGIRIKVNLELCTCSDDGCNDDPPSPTIESGKVFF